MPWSISSPNTVLANALNRTVDLLRPRIALKRPKRVEFVVGTQINGTPHLGTNLAQCAAFVLAREIRNIFSVETSVLFNALDNAPHNVELDPESFHSYQITYCHALGREKVSEITENLYRELFEGLSERTAVEYNLQLYSDCQSQPGFRKTFLRTLPLRDRLRWCVSPANGVMHVRFPCPHCHKAEKRGERTKLLKLEDDKAVFQATCFDHGDYEAIITADSDVYLDLSTIYRNLVKEAEFATHEDVLGVMVKGGDWAFACQLVDWSLAVMGYTALDAPVRWFTPQIVTDTGAKLSKSLIKRGEMELPARELSWILNTREFDGDIDDYLDALVGLVMGFLEDPKHFFRSYSYTEINRLMKSQSPEEIRENRARLIRIYRKYFDLITSGSKTIELRVGYSSMRRIKPGQLLRFVSQNESCLTRVVAVREYATFDKLFQQEDWKRINPDLPLDEQIKEVRRIFPREKEALGVLAIEIERVQEGTPE
jgi:ASC-1-like (ASCH) protein